MKQVPILDLSPHKLNKVKKFTKVPTKGVTAENVLILWQRGQLYIAEKETGMSKGDLLAHCQRRVCYKRMATLHQEDLGEGSV